ncbi:MAG TPA: phosphodiester glycosidase family protein [Gammaproteobacteria bacterium]|nr:phosphodiester glycosidase family protein [Gammaproteobacteria bacterium]
MRTLLIFVLLQFIAPGMVQGDWQALAPGMELGKFTASQPSSAGDSRITILRIDPDLWSLEFIGLSVDEGSSMQTARQWSEAHRLTAAINAGMFATDYSTHIGYLRYRGHTNNDNVNAYQSVAAFDPRREGLPRFRIFDLDSPGISLQTILQDYASIIQNLRLIKRPGQNQWSQQEKTWSEAALGEDESGRILFIFCRSPYTMHDLNSELLSLDIGLVAAQHLEGGSQAQFYLNTDETELELAGSHGTSFRNDNGIASARPIPNVLGVRPRAAGIE